MERYKEIERSIIKTYRKEIWSKFVKAVIDYELIKENDKVMVCISGGKDSFLLAKCIEELQKHGKYSFEVKYVVMDPGYSDYNRKMIEDTARELNIPIEIFESDIFEVANKLSPDSHHFDDVIETTLLSMLYGAEIKTMMPKLHSDNFEGIELIRPLYLVKENAITAWRDKHNLKFINCACSFTEKSSREDISKRKEIKFLIRELKKVNNDADFNIFKALDNVNLNCVLSYKKNKEKHSFLEEYDKR